jgi:galactose-1-phosphate uridylyltransferase
VALFSARHWLSLADFSPSLLRDNLAVALDYIRAVVRADGRVRYGAYNINYLYPSGGSLPHPHAQVYLDPYPTTLMRLQEDALTRYQTAHGSSFWADLLAEETRRGERYIAATGSIVWLTPFAPIGFNEVRAIVRGRESILDLTDDDLAALSGGIARVLGVYERLGYNSFNLVLSSGALDRNTASGVTLAMITRSALVPYYRSDAMYLERLHWEAAVDRTPEEAAEEMRPAFR